MTHSAASDTSQPNGKDKSTKGLPSEMAGRIEDTVEATQETVMQAANEASAEIRKMADSGTKFVRDNPGVAIASAVGVGILMGLALRGRD